MTQRKFDNLDRDVIAAQALGYGVRYGAYKTDHPYTREEPEEEELPQDMGKCLYCGAIFTKKDRWHRRLYCGDECRTKYSNRMQNLKRASRAGL